MYVYLSISLLGLSPVQKKPLNHNPELYYVIDYLTTFSGKNKKSYDFENLMNCYKIVKLPELGSGRQVKL